MHQHKLMHALFTPLAKAAIGIGKIDDVQFVLEHFWERRALANVILRDPSYQVVIKGLANTIEYVLKNKQHTFQTGMPLILVSNQLASGQMAAIKVWLTGQAQCSPLAFAEHLVQQSMESNSISLLK